MDNRAFEANASATPPTAPVAPSIGYPKSGNPQTSDPATRPGPYWYMSIGEEMRGVITGAGLTPNINDNTQLRQAILKMISDAAKTIRIDNAVFEASVADGEAVRWDSTNSRFDEAIADNTANNQAIGIADVTNSRVYVYGETPALFAGLTPGARYYLDGTTAGAVTTTRPSDAIIVGIAKSATTMFVDIDIDNHDLLAERNVWTKAQDVAQVTLTDAANIATDASLSNVFLVTLAGNRTLDNPTNLVAGQTIVWNINQDATGSRTLAYGNLFKFTGGTVPTLSTAASAKDTLTGVYDGTILRCSLQKGFA